MATKKILSINGSSVSNTFKDLFSYLKNTRLKIINKNGENTINIPLYLAVILGIVFPFLTIVTIILMLALSYNVSLEYEIKDKQLTIIKD